MGDCCRPVAWMLRESNRLRPDDRLAAISTQTLASAATRSWQYLGNAVGLAGSGIHLTTVAKGVGQRPQYLLLSLGGGESKYRPDGRCWADEPEQCP